MKHLRYIILLELLHYLKILLALQSQLPGFYDPCMGEDKSLYVQYSFHGVAHEVTIQDSDPLRIPKQCNYQNLYKIYMKTVEVILIFFYSSQKTTLKKGNRVDDILK